MRALRAWLIAAVGAVVLLAGWPSSAMAERRVALVIGNASYHTLTALKNPRNDASDVAAALRDLGFDEVRLVPDMTRGDILKLLEDFSRMVEGADTVLFYYAGHALEYRGQYYMAPVDATFEDGDALQYRMLSVEAVRDVLGRAKGMRLMIFDACRNDPLDPTGKVSPEEARAVRHAALIRSIDGAAGGQGTVVAYATAPLDVAEDGKGRNSPFTRAFLKWVKEAELEVRPLFQQVSREVYDQTKGRQVPEITAALRAPYTLNRAESHHSVWLRIRQSSDPIDFRDFIARFPQSEHAPSAARRLAMLERAQRLAEQRRQEEEAQRRAATCAEEATRIEALRATGQRVEIERLKGSAACPEESLQRADAALAALVAEEKARQEEAARRAAEQERLAAEQRRAAEQERLAAEQRRAAERRRAACAEEATRIEALRATGQRTEIERLRGSAACPEESLQRADAALAALAAEEKARQEKTRQEEAARRAAERAEQERLAVEQRRAAEQERLVAERRRATCAEEATRIEALRAAGQRAEIERLKGSAACPEESLQRADAALAALAAEEKARQERARQEEAARRAAERAEQERLAVEQRRAAEQERLAAERRSTACASEAGRIRAASDGSRAGLEALQGRLQCPENASLLEDALKGAAAREVQAACAAEASALAKLDSGDSASLLAFAQTARCPDVATAARATVQRIEAERDRAEQACAHDRGELERLRQLGAEGRDGLEQLGAATSCEGLKPLVVAALGTATPLAEPQPEVNAPEQVRRAFAALRQIGCVDPDVDEDGTEGVRGALRKYYAARDLEGTSLDVDGALIRRLEAEGRRRVCPLECRDGEQARGERCVPAVTSRPPPQGRERPPSASRPAATRPTATRPTTTRPEATRPAPQRQAPPKPAPPVATAPPANKRSPSIILGN